MEDAHTISTAIAVPGCPVTIAFFAVFDGHNAPACAHTAACKDSGILALFLLELQCPQPGLAVATTAAAADIIDAACVGAALHRALLRFERAKADAHHRQTASNRQYYAQSSGSTAVAMVLAGESIVVANLGDSRCVIQRTTIPCRHPSSLRPSAPHSTHSLLTAAPPRAVFATVDHKPGSLDETARIV